MKLTTIKPIVFGLFFSLFLINSGTLSSQNSGNKVAASIVLSKADLSYQDLKYAIAADYYESYLQGEISPAKEVLLKLADCYWQMRKYEDALRLYKRIYPAADPAASEKEHFRIGELFARFGQYSQASEWLIGVNGFASKANTYAANDQLNTMKRDSLRWKVQYVDINTPYREFSPFVSNKTLFFSSNKPLAVKTKAFGWDGNNFARLWQIPVSSIDSAMAYTVDNDTANKLLSNKIAKNIADVYECGDTKSNVNIKRTLAKQSYLKADTNLIGSIVPGLNTVKFNAGAISVDNNNHFYFSSNYDKPDKNGINRIRLMEGLKTELGVTTIKALPFGDPNSYSVMHPAINSDGTILVFSSNKPNGKGGYDLYYSQRKDLNQPWDSIKALSDKINTGGNEVFPSIATNGDLYFSSDAIPGLGGLDIFKMSLNDAIVGNSDPIHLSYPINSTSDDFGWTQKDSLGQKGFFTSDRFNNDDNIYSFAYVEPLKPLGKYFLKGRVLDEISRMPLKGATVFLYNKETEKILVTKTDENGNYTYSLTKSAEVVLKAVEKEHSNNCFATQFEVRPVFKDTLITPRDLLLGRFKVGYKWKLDNIHYNFDKFFIRADARPILDSVLRVLNTYPSNVELSSHTDSRGSIRYNDRLSQHRADAAVEYLIKSGINPKRITAKGYGERQLLNKCADGVKCSEEEHQANRRTEVKITGLTEEGTNLEINPDKFVDGQEIEKSALPNGFFDKCK